MQDEEDWHYTSPTRFDARHRKEDGDARAQAIALMGTRTTSDEGELRQFFDALDIDFF